MPYCPPLPGGMPLLIVHGGAGDIPKSRCEPKFFGVKQAAVVGHKVLKDTNNLIDAIEAAIKVMEDDENFNAGVGSVLTIDGTIEMEALITEGESMRAGAVALVKNVANPISLARIVLEKTPHTFIAGEGVENLIRKYGICRVTDCALITENARNALEAFKRGGSCSIHPSSAKRSTTGGCAVCNLQRSPSPDGVGTVGAVAVNRCGHVASGTSTGGMTGKYVGRIGDTPITGSGGYSDDKIGAVSTTGDGESIMVFNLAHRILTEMAKGRPAQKATTDGCNAMSNRVGKTAGAITVSNTGDVGIAFTSKRMAWAYVLDGEVHYGIDPGQHLVESVCGLPAREKTCEQKCNYGGCATCSLNR